MTSFFRRAPQNVLRVLATVADPTAQPGAALLYAKEVLGVAQLFTRSSSGVVKQLTPPDADPIVRKGIFGDGYAGTVVVSGTTTLSRDLYAETITIQPGAILNTNGYRVFARTALYNEGTVRNDGSPGVGSTGGACGIENTLRVGGNGRGTGTNGDPAIYVPAGYTASGGNGGTGTGGAAGLGGVATPLAAHFGSLRTSWMASIGLVFGSTSGGGSADLNTVGGGPGGGGGGPSPSIVGGGGGGGGGAMTLCCLQIYNAGVISALGGAGSNVSTDAGRGGGGGGAGGVILVVCDNYYGALPVVSGGAAGVSGIGAGAPTAGGAGLLIGPIPG